MYVAIFSRGRKLISCARLNALVHEFKDCMRTIDGITTHKGIPGMHTSPRKSNARLHRNTSDMGSELQRIASQCIIMGVFCIMVCIYVTYVIYIYTQATNACTVAVYFLLCWRNHAPHILYIEQYADKHYYSKIPKTSEHDLMLQRHDS